MRTLFTILIAGLFFLMSMIDTRPNEQFGYCTFNGYTIYPVSNLDCKGTFEPTDNPPSQK